MAKVWVLERFVNDIEMANTLVDIKEMNEKLKEKISDENEIAKLDKMVTRWEKKMKENPNGYWSGWEGKSNYKSFCNVAKDAIRRKPYDKFRVVEAEVKDDSRTWLGYKVVKVNDGVLRYLMATYNK